MPYVYTEADIITLLNTHNEAVKRAITILNSKEAFIGRDRNFGESLGTQLQFGRRLTPPQYTTGRRLVIKYASLLVKYANEDNIRHEIPEDRRGLEVR